MTGARPLPRVDVLRWAMGGLCALLGALVLVAPHRFSAPLALGEAPYRPLWGAGALLAGVGLFAAAVLRPRRAALAALHGLAAAVLAALAASFAQAGIWVASAAYVLLAAGTAAAGVLPPGPAAPRDPRPDLFALLMAAVAAVNGVALLALPALSSAHYFDPSRRLLPPLGLALLTAGTLLAAAQLWRAAPARFVAAAHLAAGAAFFAFGAVVSARQEAWTALAVNWAYAVVLALLPWLARRLAGLDSGALRTRLALVLASATCVALVATAAVATWQEEELALHHIRETRAVEAAATARRIAEFLDLTGGSRPPASLPTIVLPGASVELWDGHGHRIAGGTAGDFAPPPLPAGWDSAVREGRAVAFGRRLVGLARVPGRDWVVAVERAAAAELAGVRRGRDLAFGLLLLVVPLAIAGGIFFGRRIARPLGRLADAVAALAAGDAAAPLGRSDISEVSRLSAAFAELRDRLAERTRESERLQGELRARAEALAESDRRKDEFLAMLAHELRNPLGAIANAAFVQQQLAPQEPRLQRTVTIIQRQIGHIVRLVDDLLDVSRITRGKVTLRRERLDLRDAVRQAADTSRPLFEAKRHRLELDLPAEPLPLDADATRLDQIIVNLLGNAAKYTDEGGDVEVAARREGQHVVLRVRDSGRGIAPHLLPHVFDLFTQGSDAPDRSGSGLGVGLTLVRSLVELHGGAVEARSEGPGHGSEFVVRLPGAG